MFQTVRLFNSILQVGLIAVLFLIHPMVWSTPFLAQFKAAMPPTAATQALSLPQTLASLECVFLPAYGVAWSQPVIVRAEICSGVCLYIIEETLG
jgi:hypothetical protein